MLTYLSLITHFEYNLPPNYQLKRFTERPDPDFQKYLNAVHYFDRYLEKFFEQLEKRKLLRNTLIVLVGDHGEAFGEHFRRQHDSGMWEEQLRIPLVIYNRELIPQKRVIKGLRQQIDLLPTIAELLGFRIEGGKLPGKSLLEPVNPERTLFFSCSYQRYCIGVRKGWIKYIFNYRRHPSEVYDLQKDPGERFNLSKIEPYRSLLPRQIERSLIWRERVNLIYRRNSRK